METIMLSLDLDKICRICLLQSDSMFSIYSQLFDHLTDEKMPTISDILVSISNIKIREGDTLPTMICTRCINSAHIAHKFQQQCNTSQAILESYLDQVKVKESNVIECKREETDLVLNDEDLLAEGLEYIANDCLINDDSNLIQKVKENDECDDLKNCIPLGEDTVDQLIDNFSVGNLELISPKLDFNLNIEETGRGLIPPPDPPREPVYVKKCPSMDYYKRNKDDDVIYDCNQCEESFDTPNDLRVHFKTHDEKRPYSCTDCKKTFKTYAHLLFHIRRHAEKKIFECKECGKKYKQSGTLTAHMRIHTGSKPFLCSVCGRGFRQAPDLTYHMRTHTKEKPYMCNVCGKTMSMQCHLVQHMRSHTGEKPFKCQKCDKAFPSSTRLKRHSIVHTALKPFKCNLCDKSFNRNSSLKVHNRTHTGIKSYKCSTCNKSFLWAHSLRAHAATHIKDDVQEVDESLMKYTTMTIYADDKDSMNESFAIFANEDSKTFQICTVSTGEQLDGVETFTLYSADDVDQIEQVQMESIKL